MAQITSLKYFCLATLLLANNLQCCLPVPGNLTPSTILSIVPQTILHAICQWQQSTPIQKTTDLATNLANKICNTPEALNDNDQDDKNLGDTLNQLLCFLENFNQRPTTMATNFNGAFQLIAFAYAWGEIFTKSEACVVKKFTRDVLHTQNAFQLASAQLIDFYLDNLKLS